MQKIIYIISFYILPLVIAGQNNNNISLALNYPESKKIQTVDTFFGKEIIDNYKWLEDEESEETKIWLQNQKNFTKQYFKDVKYRSRIKRLIEYYSMITIPKINKEGQYYFSFQAEAEKASPSLFFRKTLSPNKTKLVDPLEISEKDNISITEYHTSKNSNYLAYSYSRNGHELKEIQIVSLPDGKKMNDLITNYTYPDISWQREGIAWKGNGFFYSRIGKPGEKINLKSESIHQYIYYHRIGTSEAYDSLIFIRENNPEIYSNLFTSSDERFFILIEKNYKTQRLNVYVEDFKDNIKGLKILVKDFEKSIKFIDNIDNKIMALTDYKADNNWIVSINPDSISTWDLMVPNIKDAVLLDAQMAGGKIVGIYQSLSKQEQYLLVFDYNGNLTFSQHAGQGISIGGLMGKKGDNELLLYFESYANPPVYTVFDLSQDKFTLRINNELYDKFNCRNYITEKHRYKSIDGTEIPITIVRNKKKFHSDGNNITILTAYGGYGMVVPVHFSPDLVFFLENGGVFAFAHIRGGGELGSDWYQQGKGLKKYNSVDDFIAAAEFLVSNNYTTPAKLAITGTSHGGFIVGAALTKRPELFRVAIPKVGLFDLISTLVQPDEFGNISDSIGINYRLGLSPLHSIKNKTYPSIFIITAENDDRVPPFHSLKFTAALQNISENYNPIVLKMEEKGGHFGVWNYSSWIEEKTDMYSFIFHNMGLKPK